LVAAAKVRAHSLYRATPKAMRGDRNLNGFGIASKEANFITELPLVSTLAAAASGRARK